MKDKWVKVELTGGLGNQLFGLCYGLNLHKSCGHNVMLDSGNLWQRGLQIDNNALPGNIVVQKSSASDKTLHGKILRKARISMGRKVFFEKSHQFEDSSLNCNALRHIGYFQHWQYVENVKKEMQNYFSKILVKSKFLDKELIEIANSEFIAVHIRRGDYLNSKGFHVILGSAYYQSALAMLSIRSRTDQKLVVFSDDIEAAKSIIPGANHYVGAEKLSSPIANLLLMGKAQAIISANSTLSWWSSWLVHNNGGIVFLPDTWFGESKFDAKSLQFPEWNQVKSQ